MNVVPQQKLVLSEKQRVANEQRSRFAAHGIYGVNLVSSAESLPPLPWPMTMLWWSRMGSGPAAKPPVEGSSGVAVDRAWPLRLAFIAVNLQW